MIVKLHTADCNQSSSDLLAKIQKIEKQIANCVL